ncbi:MAG: TlpA disulfide reductase family protein [Acidimicrobiales bacterium]
MISRRSILICSGVAVVVGAIALISDLTGSNGTGNPPAPVAALVGQRVKDFSIGGLNGGTITAPWESGKASVLVFFASYCVPCRSEMPIIAKYLRAHSPKAVEVLGVDTIDERSSAESMVKRDGVTFPVAFDPNGVVTTGVFGFGQIPESVFVNTKGVVEKVYFGAIPKRQLALGIRSLETTRK